MADSRDEATPDAYRVLASFALHRGSGTHAWLTAAGSSMHPLICTGDRLYVEFGSRRPRLGEIVVFADSGRVVAHRLVRRRRTREGEVLVARGDATLAFDRPFSAYRLLGIVRSCRRADDGALTPVVGDGPAAVVLAGISVACGQLLLGVDRLPAAIRRPLGRIVRRLALAIVARSARAAASWARLRGFDRSAPQPDADVPGGPDEPLLPTVE